MCQALRYDALPKTSQSAGAASRQNSICQENKACTAGRPARPFSGGGVCRRWRLRPGHGRKDSCASVTLLFFMASEISQRQKNEPRSLSLRTVEERRMVKPPCANADVSVYNWLRGSWSGKLFRTSPPMKGTLTVVPTSTQSAGPCTREAAAGSAKYKSSRYF